MNKYRNKKTIIKGIEFSSIKESERFLELSQWQKEDRIRDLKLQPTFVLQKGFVDLQGRKHRPITYIADFMYWEPGNPEFMIVEDVKGFSTEVYKIKKKLFLYQNRTGVIFKEL